MLFVGIALASYMYILDNGTNWQWGALASTKFLAYNEWLSIGAVTSTLRKSYEHSHVTFAFVDAGLHRSVAVGKPLFAKLTDTLGRAEVSPHFHIVYAETDGKPVFA